jgi:hypothetical protein
LDDEISFTFIVLTLLVEKPFPRDFSLKISLLLNIHHTILAPLFVTRCVCVREKQHGGRFYMSKSGNLLRDKSITEREAAYKKYYTEYMV